MEQAQEQERIQVDSDQTTIVLAYANQHQMAPADVLRHAVAMYVGANGQPDLGAVHANFPTISGATPPPVHNPVDALNVAIQAARAASEAIRKLLVEIAVPDAPSLLQGLNDQLKALESQVVAATAVAGPSQCAPRVSRHPGRDYSAFGSIRRLPDGMEYQNAAREEW